ncbi:glycosyltransferase family 4 protein [Candidatus Peregrinibacteria bacterium]|nr:glycosyltransferase family 4 protein [Candidatus Peregrinibacteria bacterium]
MPNRFISVHQFTSNLSYGDAISNDILEIQKTLLRWGYHSEIYGQHVDQKMTKYFHHFETYKGNSKNIILFHASIGCALFDYIKKLPDKKILIYHNITPPSYFEGYNDVLSSLLLQGQTHIRKMQPYVDIAVGDSDFNTRELIEYGYKNTATLPIYVDFKKFDKKNNHHLLAELCKDDTKNVLFVGRFSPNKCQHDIIKAFYIYKNHFEPNSRLILIGNHNGVELYMAQLKKLVSLLHLEDSVVFSGHVSLDDLVTYYRAAHLFLSMSEHEGFMVPLLESFYFNVPVLAYEAGAVPETLGNAGITFKEKKYEKVAQSMDSLIRDESLRNTVLQKQQERLKDFFQKRVEEKLQKILCQLQ